MTQDFFDSIPTDLPGGFFVYRATGGEELCFADNNVLQMFGCESMEEFRILTGNSFRGMVVREDLDQVEQDIRRQTFDSDSRHDYVHYRIRTKQGVMKYVEDFGHLVFDKDGDSFFYVFIVELEQKQFQQIEQADWESRVGYRHAEQPDEAMGLHAQSEFFARCEHSLSDVSINWLLVAIDIQNFKLFNEWYGRDSGDVALAEIGRLLGQFADTHDGVAGYLGSDDFALLVPAGYFDAEKLYRQIHNIIIEHGASVGFLPVIGASYSRVDTSAYTLYDQASLARQEAKGDPKTHIKFFSQAMVSRAEEDHKVLSQFKDALRSHEITFFLQPQCRTANGQVVGAEALARWIKPDGKMIPPYSFIPTLERYGFIPDLDKAIWEAVCRWSRKIIDEGKPMVPVSVNISPVDIFTMDVPAFLHNLISRYDLPMDAIKLEITESAYSEGSEKIRSTVKKLRDMGFVVLMDDFGSGFSSLNMLRELNVDIIKLDAYFLRMDKQNERKGMHIIESVVNMAKTLSLPIIVEGVETKEQCEYLMGLGIRYVQGYYFYKPMPTEDFEALIAQRDKVSSDGFVFKANEEFRMREFLNDSVYSDSMLNQIIGPAAIYSYHGGNIDIIRFNQMFYRAVNVPDFHAKLLGIQRYMPPEEVPVLYETLKKAYDDRLNGARAVLTFKRIDNSAAQFFIHFYFLNEDDDQRRFYGSARDVTEITNLHRHMELLSRFSSRTVVFLLYRQGRYSFEVVAHGLERDMGLNREQLVEELNNRAFCKRMMTKQGYSLWNVALQCAEQRKSTSTEITMQSPKGGSLTMVVDADYVDDELGDVRCILSMGRRT